MTVIVDEQITQLYVLYCPKCGLIVPDPSTACPWCNYSAETALTPEEAREFTLAGD